MNIEEICADFRKFLRRNRATFARDYDRFITHMEATLGQVIQPQKRATKRRAKPSRKAGNRTRGERT